MNEQLLQKLTARLAGVYRTDEYPALDHQLRSWSASQPLQGLRILDATPIFRNTLVKYLPLLAGGAELSVGIAGSITPDPQVVQFLREAGIPVLGSAAQVQETYDLILDCAASFAACPARIGYVELTRSGVPRYESVQKPVYVADSGRIKQIETLLGTGESFFRAMRRRGYTDWRGRKLVVFGSGKVGSGIIFYALREGAEVTVVTELQTLSPKLIRQVARAIPLDDYPAIAQAVGEAYAVVTATGVAGAVTRCEANWAAIESQALLVNMGVEDEYGPSVPVERVLGGKLALNFELEEPTHLKYIDATLALHNAGALHLIRHPEAHGLIIPAPEEEEELLRVSCERGAAGGEIAELLR